VRYDATSAVTGRYRLDLRQHGGGGSGGELVLTRQRARPASPDRSAAAGSTSRGRGEIEQHRRATVSGGDGAGHRVDPDRWPSAPVEVMTSAPAPWRRRNSASGRIDAASHQPGAIGGAVDDRRGTPAPCGR
jgi:hypothetical protein